MIKSPKCPRQFYTISSDELFDLVKSVPKSIVQRCFRLFSSRQTLESQRRQIIEFYMKNRSEPKKVELVDVGSGQLMDMVVDVVSEFATDHKHFIDVGCGNASLSELPVIKSAQYTGIDLVIDRSQVSKRLNLIEAPINGDLKIIDELKPRFFICVHLACYLEVVDELINFFQSNSEEGDYILLVEPSRMPFWETRFDGIDIYLRGRRSLCEVMNAAEFSLIFEGGLYVTELLGWPIIEVSSLQVFKKL